MESGDVINFVASIEVSVNMQKAKLLQDIIETCVPVSTAMGSEQMYESPFTEDEVNVLKLKLLQIIQKL